MSMNLQTLTRVILLFLSLNVFAQDINYSSFTIPEALKKNANAVVRINSVNVNLNSPDQMTTTIRRVVTVLNKQGNRHVDAYTHYDDNSRIKSIKATVYNDLGIVIKKFKKNDFKDESAIDNNTLFSDSRVKYLDYTPITYPYTIEYLVEKTTDGTAFIRSFIPIDAYYLSVENSTYNLRFSPGMNLRKKEISFDDIELIKKEESGNYYFQIQHIPAIKPEAYSQAFHEIVPRVLFALNQFSYEGVRGNASNWDELGKWVYLALMEDTYDLPAGTVGMIQNLVKDEETDIDKARKIYQYVQDKTRYISVQIGVGGWKPFKVSEVDKLGYGDCKALTNYTKALLDAVGISSNYAVVFAGSDMRSMDSDFAKLAGTHAILNIPQENGEDIWLECTSQTSPFGYIANFTDNRDVFLVKPEGGKIKRTKKYGVDENTQEIIGHCELDPNGNIIVDASIASRGIQYGYKYHLKKSSAKEQEEHYKEEWDYINNLVIDNIEFTDDREDISFTETIQFKAGKYASLLGDRMLFNINVLSKSEYIPDRYRNRTQGVEVLRGFKDSDVVKIILPEGYSIEALPEGETIETKFGSYIYSLELKDQQTLIYKRELTLLDGVYPKEDYAAFRNFYRSVARKDNLKVSIIKN